MTAPGSPPPTTPHADPTPKPRGRYLARLSLLALGVVYGDIGTSPLYAMREAFHGQHGIPVTAGNVFGVLSLIFWSLILIVTIKYHVVIIRAHNKGEGGVLALMALVNGSRLARGLSPRRIMIVLGIFGAALLYADGALTPAISVLSAVEGLQVAAPALERWVIWITSAILVGLFMLQSRGTAGIGAIFGPVMLAWFAAIAVLGLNGILRHPAVVGAALPTHAVQFFAEDPGRGLLVLGAVFLAVTGGEALYADLGHFGHTAIQLAWFTIPLPALMLNYFGQGALLLTQPEAAANPFYLLAPQGALYLMIPLATAAAIIASQAVISGAFSLTRQAVQLGYIPRMEIEHTSSREIGQIYVPTVNKLLAVLTIALVFGFRTSSNLAGAYGVALATLMALTTVMFYVMSREVWGWSLPKALAVSGVFLIVDMTFLAANALKIWHGGWVPLAIAIVLFWVMSTWKRGREILAKRMNEKTVPLKLLLADLAAEPPTRVPGTAVFMYGSSDGTPPALVLNLAHNKVLHEKIVFLTVITEDVPHVGDDRRVTVKRSGKGFHTVVARYGFMQDPDISEVLTACKKSHLDIPLEGTTFFLGRETLIASDRQGMAMWRERLFAFMSRNALRATAFFKIPPNQVFEVGAYVEL
ncbi:MAG TPA: potassium transporter Kup [Gemmatimonadales bacterium]|nr:potassium transporter Kup [Gemmatimonadales bacterium]